MGPVIVIVAQNSSCICPLMAVLGCPWEELCHLYSPPHVQEEEVDGPIQPLIRRAFLAMKLGDWPAAERQLDAALAIWPTSRELHDMRAAMRLYQRNVEGALEDAREVTASDPSWPRGWTRLGTAQLSLGHPQAACSAFRRALTLEGGSVEAAAGLRLAEAALAAQADRRASLQF